MSETPPSISALSSKRSTKGTLDRSRSPGLSRLRDYGAFQADISTLVTHRLLVIKDTGQNPAAPGTPVTPSSVAYPKAYRRFAGAIKIIPFQTKGMRVQCHSLAPAHQIDHVEQMKATRQKASGKKVVSLALRFGMTLLLFVLLGRSVSWSTLLVALLHVRLGMVSLSLVVGAGGIVLSAYQWRSLLHGEGIRLDLADLINMYVVGIAFSHFLPTGMGGDAVKAFYVGRESGNNAGSASAVVLCRVTGFVGMLLVAVPVLIIWHAHFRFEFITTFVLLSLLVGSMIGGALAAVMWLPRLFRGRLANRRVFVKVRQVGETLLAALKRPRFMCLALAYGIMFWVLAIMNCYAYGSALGIPVPSYFYIVVVPLIALVSFLPLSINGFGLRESAYVYTFSTMHVAPATALLLALLLDTQALLFGIAGGCVYFSLSSKAKALRMQRAGRAA